MKVMINGSTGRMGKILEARALAGGEEIAALVSPSAPAGGGEKCYAALAEFDGEADCVIDFSLHNAVGELLRYCMARKLPVVIATTGHDEAERAQIAEAAKTIPVFFAANMSLGVAVTADLARRAAAAFPEAEIEIVERHHDRKIDVPSGTALALAHEIQSVREGLTLVVGRHANGKRAKNEIGIHSLRLGNEVGTHEIIIATGSETLTIKHEAEDRALFADGALAAARFLCGKGAGLYTMRDMIAD